MGMLSDEGNSIKRHYGVTSKRGTRAQVAQALLGK